MKERGRGRPFFPTKFRPKKSQKRKQIVLRLSEKIAFDLREQFIGRKMKVLIENSEGEGSVGHTENFLKVFLPTYFPPHTIVEATCIANSAEGLVGTC